MNYFKYFIVLFILIVSTYTDAQTLLLPERWKFKMEDRPEFSNPEYSDASWDQIYVPAAWENEGYSFDSTAWYRVHFDVEKQFDEDSLYLVLGKIDDADETYLNGKLVGSMGKFSPLKETAYDKQRIYKIPAILLKDNDNVLAVRVNDWLNAGGIVSGPIGLYNEWDYREEFDPEPGAKKSFYQLVTSNGLIAAVYDEKRNIIESVRPHLFQAYDSARYVEPFIYRIKPNVKERPSNVFYDNNTHVIRTAYDAFNIYYFAPFTTEEKVFYAVISGPSSEIKGCSFSYEKRNTRILADSIIFQRAGKRLDKYYLFSFTDSIHMNEDILIQAKKSLKNSDGTLVKTEIKFMKDIFSKCRIPESLSGKERALLEQSIAVLKMGQVSRKEIFPLSRGQILASLPPGNWNISWVRDGVYAILGLNSLGLFDEARAMLEFMLNAKSGQYVHYVHSDGKDYGIGVPYKISVCRYFGMGREESDYASDTGPNVEIDGFGLTLIALCNYIEQSRDTAFFNKYYDIISREIADAIIHCIDKNNLIKRDSGPWERHLPGKQFAYPSIVCAAGLRDFAKLSTSQHPDLAERYQKAYQRLLAGITANLVVNNKWIKGNVQASDSASYDYFDGGTFEAFSLGLFSDKELFISHMEVCQRALGVEGGINGFSRINKGDWYEVAEWGLLDLRAAIAYKKFGDREGAKRLIDWVTDQASLNFNMIPELYNEKTSHYGGAIPMVGFGAGAYAVTLLEFYSGK